MASIHIADHLIGTPAAEREVIEELRLLARTTMEGTTPGQRSVRRAIDGLKGKQAVLPIHAAAPVSVQIHVDPKRRQVITRRIAANGQVLAEDRRKARRHTRVHMIDGHIDVVESVEGVAAAIQAGARAGGMFQANAIGGHGQITLNFVPVSSVVRLEDLRR